MTDSSDGKDKVREHSFDGIQEYDNQLPRWWVYKFLLTIVFAAAYFYWYELSESGRSLYESFIADKKSEAETQESRKPAEPAASEDELLALAKNDAALKSGAEIFKAKCTSCHGSDGEGTVGPNFTDKYWIHGGRLTDIVKTISEGVPEKGMITWKSQLSRTEIHQVAAYVKSLQGKAVRNPKKPEGVLVP